MVRLYGTFIFTGVQGACALVRAHRTSSNLLTQIARRVEFFHMSSGWFNCTEPSQTTSLQGKQGVQGACALVRAHRTSSNLLEPHHRRDNKVFSHEFGVVRLYGTFSNYILTGETRCAGCLCTSSGWFKRIEPFRTFSNHIIAEIARCVEFFHKSSGWFDCTELSLTTSLQGKQGVQGAFALVRGGSSASNLFEPSRTTSLQR